MPQQACDLIVGKTEYFRGQVFLVGTLTEYPQLFQPRAHAGRMLAIAVATDHKLMPGAGWTFVSRHRATKCFGGRTHDGAVLFINRRVAQRLMYRVAAIAYKMPEQDQPMFRPALGFGGCWQAPCHGQPIALRKHANSRPSAPGEQAMFRSGPEAAAACGVDANHCFTTDVPNLGRAGGMKPLRFIERPHLGRGTHKISYRNAPAVGQADQRIAGDAP